MATQEQIERYEELSDILGEYPYTLSEFSRLSDNAAYEVIAELSEQLRLLEDDDWD